MIAELMNVRSNSHATTVVGLLTSITAGGRPMVDYPGNAGGPMYARSIVAELPAGSSVLLMFEDNLEDNRPATPIIIGVVRDTVRDSSKSSKNTVIECNKLAVVAHEEISFRCGTAALIMRKDGKTVTKGKDVVSRASRTNKVQGASVRIN